MERRGDGFAFFSRNQNLKLKNTVLMVIFKSSSDAYAFSKGYVVYSEAWNYIALIMIEMPHFETSCFFFLPPRS